jgi:hypothetical protein
MPQACRTDLGVRNLQSAGREDEGDQGGGEEHLEYCDVALL